MLDRPPSQTSPKAGALWRVSLGLLLLCSLAIGAGATTQQDAYGTERPLFQDQTNQLTWANAYDNQRVRSNLRKHNSKIIDGADEGTDNDGAAQLIVAVEVRLHWCRLKQVLPTLSSTLTPPSHLLPAPRAPPLHA